MTIKEIKDWLANIPADMDQVPLVIRTLKDIDEEGKFSQRDEPIVSALLDQNNKRLCFFNMDSQKMIEKIRTAVKEQQDQPDTTNE